MSSTVKQSVASRVENIFLAGDKISLRPIELDDLEGSYVGWLNDPEVCRFNSHHVFPYSKKKAEQYILSTSSNRSLLVLAITLSEDNRHVGNIALQNIHPVNRSAEFSILIGDKSVWGQGIAKEAGYMLCKHGFSELNLHRIYCGTEERNIGMQKLALFLGMKEEGRFRQSIFKHGAYRDTIHYSVLKDEFDLNFH